SSGRTSSQSSSSRRRATSKVIMPPDSSRLRLKSRVAALAAPKRWSIADCASSSVQTKQSPSCPASAKNSSRKAPIRSFSSPLTTSSRWCSNRSRNLSIRSGSCCGSRPKARWAIVSATVCPKDGSFANTPLAQFFSAKSLICSRLPACLIDTNVSLPYFSARSHEGLHVCSPEPGSGMSEVRIARRRSSSSAGEFVADVERGRARHLREGAGAHGEDHELAGRTGGFVEELRVRVEAGGRIDDLAHV